MKGGELVIEDTFGEQRIKLAAGDAIVYPGTSLHRVACHARRASSGAKSGEIRRAAPAVRSGPTIQIWG